MSAWVKGKVVFVGDASVGKTCIIASQNRASQSYIQPTIAASSVATKVDYNGTEVTLNVWDTAGQDDYRCLVPMYAHYSQVAVIVFSVTDAKSFESIPSWVEYLKSNADIPNIFLVANKIDLASEVDEASIVRVAEEQGLKLFQTSARTGENIENLFYAIAGVVESGTDQDDIIEPVIHVTNNREQRESKKCC